MEPDLIIQEPPRVLKQYEVMQWDGTRENFKRIKEWAKPHNIIIVGFASGKEYIEFDMCHGKYPTLVGRGEYVFKTIDGYLSSVTLTEFREKYSDWTVLQV